MSIEQPVVADIDVEWSPEIKAKPTFPIPPPSEAKVFPQRLRPKPGPFDPEEDDGRCKGTSWAPARMKGPQGTAARKNPGYENFYGPGGYNRCIYTTEEHVQHCDEWGNVFTLDPWTLIRIVRMR